MKPQPKMRYAGAFAVLLALLAVLFVWNVNSGSLHLSVREVAQILLTHSGDNAVIVWEIRLPRIFAAILLGGALSVSGFLLQTFFANPIAGPFVLGISSGAKLTVALTMIGALSCGRVLGSAVMITAAFAGAMLSMGFVLLIAQRVRQMPLLVVSGVMIGYICSAVTDFVITFAEDSNIVNLHNWSMGSFSGISWDNIRVMTPVVLVSLVCVFLLSKPISAYQLGEGYARSMGVNIAAFRVVLILLSSVLSACRTDLVRRHRGSASCEKPVRHGKADPDDTGVLSRRCGILPAVRSHRADGVCTDGAEYQHRDSFVWCAGRHLYYGAPEVLQRVSLRPHAEGVGANPWLGDQKDRHQGFYPLGTPVSYC